MIRTSRVHTLSEWIEETFRLSPATQTRLLVTVVAVLAIWLARRLVLAVVARRTADIALRYRWRKTSAYVAVVVAVLVVGPVWFEGLRTIATFLGLLGAGIVIALKDVITAVAGWVIILWRQPFTVGDRIQIGRWAGDVVDVRLFRFTMIEIGNWVDADQSTGRIVHVPNGWVLTEPVANYTQGFEHVWNEIPVRITFESDWRQAKALLQEILERNAPAFTREAEAKLRRAADRMLIHYSKLTPAVYTRGTEHGVVLTGRYLCEPRRRRASEEAIWEDVLEEFGRRPEIRFAYPTLRIYGGDEPPPRTPPASPERRFAT